MTVQTATTFTIDPVHSTVEFAVKHRMIATVRGRFGEFEGTIRFDDEDPARSSVQAVIQSSSVDSGVAMRDDDLRSPNFLDAERYPLIRFASTAVERLDKERWRVTGDLTLRDVTRQVVLDTEFEGRGPGMEGEERIGFTAHTSINRKDYGLAYNAVVETGGLVVSDTVRITLHVEGVAVFLGLTEQVDCTRSCEQFEAALGVADALDAPHAYDAVEPAPQKTAQGAALD